MGKVVRWHTIETNFLINNYKKYNYDEMSKIMGRSPNGIRHQANSLKLKSPHTNKFKDITWLLDDSLETFYWAGFILADGTVNFNTKSVKVVISKNDESHIRKIATKMSKYKDIVYIYSPKNGFSKNTTLVEVSAADSFIIPKFCDKYDIKRCKTYNPPNLEHYVDKFSKEQILSLIIGYIDGDGYITKNNGINFIVHTAWKDNIQFIIDYIYLYFNKVPKPIVKIRYNKYAQGCVGNRALVSYIKDFIDTNKLPVMGRKWDKIEPIARNIEPEPKNYNSHLKTPVKFLGIDFESYAAACRFFGCDISTIKSYQRDINWYKSDFLS